MPLCFYACTEVTLSGWIPTFLRTERAFTEFSAGQVVSFFWFAIIIGRIFIGFFSRKFGILKILISITILSIISIILGLYSSSVAVIFTSFIAAGFFIAGIWPLIVTEVGILFPTKRNSMISLAVLFGGSGGFFAPFLLGFVYNKFDLSVAMNLSYIFLFLSLIFFLVLFFFRKKNDGKRSSKI